MFVFINKLFYQQKIFLLRYSKTFTGIPVSMKYYIDCLF